MHEPHTIRCPIAAGAVSESRCPAWDWQSRLALPHGRCAGNSHDVNLLVQSGVHHGQSAGKDSLRLSTSKALLSLGSLQP